MPALEGIEDTIQRVCVVIAAITNIFLLHLIINKSPPNFGAYKYLMIYTSVFEIIYAIVDVVLIPKLVCHGSAYLIIVSANRSVLPSWALPYFTVLYCTTFGMAMAIFSVHFIFRYLVVNGDVVWTSKSPSKLFIWIMAPVVCGVFATIICQVFWSPNEAMNMYIKTQQSKYFLINFQKDYYLGLYFYPINSSGVQIFYWRSFFGTLLLFSIITTSSCIMLYFGIKCYKALCKLTSVASHVSAKSRTIQTQLFYALVVQTIIPIALMHLPGSVLFMYCFADASFPVLGRIWSVTIAMYPAIDPLPNMFIIAAYRKAIIGNLKRVELEETRIVCLQDTFRVPGLIKNENLKVWR